MKKSLGLILALSVLVSNAFACGGANYSRAKLSPNQRAAIEAEIAKAGAESDEISRRNATLDKAIAVAKVVDVLVSQGVSLVPYGGAAYSGGKAVGYAAMGEAVEAGKAAVWGVIGTMSVAGSGEAIGTVSKVVLFLHDADGAVSVGTQTGEAFSQ